MDPKARAQLVRLLRDAARLEHCLLNAYLFTACSLKSRPEEFATLLSPKEGKRVENLRRALHFEFARDWKTHMLDVAREEMLHLHYVNCLLRALGERPEFGLPARGGAQNAWFIPDWQPLVGGEPQDGVSIPLEGLTEDTIRRFVMYESTDALQTSDLFNQDMLNLFEDLRKWELALRIELILHNESRKELSEEQKAQLDELRLELKKLYEEQPPTEAEGFSMPGPYRSAEGPRVKFRSIADLYNRAILPLYHQAFDLGWVKEANRDLNNELQGAPADEGHLLRAGPIYRDKNFASTAKRNQQAPLSDARRVEEIIREIVEEGEGFVEFERRAKELIRRRPSDYLEELLLDRSSAEHKDQKRPHEWLADGERLRKSHLYRFALIRAEQAHELKLCKEADLEFSAARQQVHLEGNLALRQMREQFPGQFNACYLVVCAWLSRLYETQDWLAGKPRRLSIQMLATWPLMSLAIRPFLELASFLGQDVHQQLFRQDEGSLPQAPTHALQLLRLFAAEARSEEICARMDYLAVRVLEDVATWAEQQLAAVKQGVQEPLAREMMLRRLEGLSTLREFKKQFTFRVHGGYSGQAPDLAYLQEEKDAALYEEDPTGQLVTLSARKTGERGALFSKTLVLRLRFQGWGSVQLATDPDPPTEEVGCSGVHLLHAADSSAFLDRSLFWQPHEGAGAIERGPLAGPEDVSGGTPGLGVQCVDVSLLAADEAKAVYKPYRMMKSTSVAQVSGAQLDLSLSGLTSLLSLTSEAILGKGNPILIDLKPRGDGRRPYLVGENHLVWKDGEPIDPFILEISHSGMGEKGEISREVFNEGKKFIHFTPLQRLMSGRGPTGAEIVGNVPAWVKLPSSLHRALQQEQGVIPYIKDRADALTGRLAEQVRSWKQAPSQTQRRVDEAVSLAERARRLNLPREETIIWLSSLMHYSHTLSGEMTLPDEGGRELPSLQAIKRLTNLDLRILGAQPNRNAPNARWLVHYTLGAMDTDALVNLIYGEVYVPLAINQLPGSGGEPITLTRRWSFAPGTQDAVKAYACDFARPFWAGFKLDDKGVQRKAALPDGTEIIETLEKSDASGYSYSLTGLPFVSSYEGRFEVQQVKNGATELLWRVQFQPRSAEALVPVILLIARAGQDMATVLQNHFAPREVAG